MSWHFSRGLRDDILSSLQSRIYSEAQRAKDLSRVLSPEKQCERSQWAKNRSAVEAICSANDQGRIFTDVLREAPVREWAKNDPCSCDGDGVAHLSSNCRMGMRPSQKRGQDRQQVGKFRADEFQGALQNTQFRVFEKEEAGWRAICVSLRPMWHRKNCAKKNKWEGR